LLVWFECRTSITATVGQRLQTYNLSEETLFKQKRGTIVVPLTVVSIITPGFYMKTVSKNSSDLLSNSITRNIIIILIAALLIAVVIVTSSIIVYNRIYNQW
jgi:hypothetical protein